MLVVSESNEEMLLKQALEMSMQPEDETPPTTDFAMMSEDEQIAYAMRMSMQAEGTDFNECNFCSPRDQAEPP